MKKPSLAMTQRSPKSCIPTLARLFQTVFIIWAASVSSTLAQDPQGVSSDTSDSPMVAIPAGEFMMGVPRWEDGTWGDQQPHKVVLDTFSIDRYEVTNIQFKQFVESTGYRTDAEKEGWGTVIVEPSHNTKRIKGANWKRPEGKESVFSTDRDQHPVVSVSWGDAKSYCEWQGKRLPTDAEWEYAARASTTTPFWWGDRDANLVGNFADETFAKIFPDANTLEYASPDTKWYLPNYQDGFGRTAPVGSFKANHWGLYDMSGNVWEWVSDWDDPAYDPKSEYRNPQGPLSGEGKITRGGAWEDLLIDQRPTSRRSYGPLSQSPTIGFRCAQDGVAPNATKVSSAPAQASLDHTEGENAIETPGRTPLDEDIPHEMTFVPSGKFWMGSYEGIGDPDEYPRHQVYLDAFFIDQYEVTVAQYAKFMDATGSPQPEHWDDKTVSAYPRKPVVDVNWDNAQSYCKWAGKRLPTEAEWEKAARGIDERLFPWGNTTPHSGVVNRSVSYTDDLYKEQLDVVGKYEDGKSPYGVYDMAGNAMEWVADWYGEQYYRESPDQNPAGPEHGTEKVIRGGSSLLKNRFLRTAKRERLLPSEGFSMGFRCAQDIASLSSSSNQEPVKPSQLPSRNQPSITVSPKNSSISTVESMVLLPGGEFLMGPTSSDFMSTGVPRPIKVAVDSFYFDQYEVTNEQFRHFIESTNYQTLAEKEGAAPALIGPENMMEDTQGANWKSPEGKEDVFSSNRSTHPVVTVSWEGAQAYCKWSGKRLPTEAEWEYAAKAGTSTPYWWGKELGSNKIVNVEDMSFSHAFPPPADEFSEFEETAPLEEDTYDDGFARTAPVGSFPPNPWKLYDMLGNVAEWVADWEDELSEETNKVHQNPKGPSTGLNKVVRGGSWQNYVQDSASRYGEDPLNQTPDLGFRCAKDIGDKQSTTPLEKELVTPEGGVFQSHPPDSQEGFPEIDIKDIPMVLVPQGSFSKYIPVSDNDPTTFDTDEEKQIFSIASFYLDQHEVTNEQFSTFAQTTNYQTKAERVGYAWVYTDQGWKKRKQASWVRPQGEESIIESSKRDHPVVSVSWDDANAYCGWAGKRLPTEAEWEYAARAWSRFDKAYDAYQALTNTDNLGNFLDGSAARAFPLSAIPDASNDGAVRTAPIGSFPANAWQLHDMLGNVWEWVSNRDDSLYPPDDYETNDPSMTPRIGAKVVRGASWAEDRANDLWDNRLKLKARFRSDAMGFRCAKDYSKTSETDVRIIITPKFTKEEKPKALSNEDLTITLDPRENLLETLETPMVLIPEGEFMMGASDQELTHDQWSLASIPEDDLLELEVPEDIEVEESEEFIPLDESDDPLEVEGLDCQFFPDECEAYHRIRPRHNVMLDAFYLDKYEVTNEQFAAFVHATNYQTLAEQTGKAYGYTTQTDPWGGDIKEASWRRPEGTISVFDSDRASHPVVSVSWAEAKAYCEWTGKRLPTEAEWEYAARSGTTTQFWWGNDYPESEIFGNFADKSTQWKNLLFSYLEDYVDGFPRTSPVGSFRANPWGLFDMTGNVKEWVADWYDKDYYSNSPEHAPAGPPKGLLKIARGNSWTSQDLSLAERFSIIPTHVSADLGFRCARDEEPSGGTENSDTVGLKKDSVSQVAVTDTEESNTEEDTVSPHFDEKGEEKQPATLKSEQKIEDTSLMDIPLEPSSPKSLEDTQISMVLIPGGQFVMGASPGNEHDSMRSTYNVKLSPFYLDQYEVTNDQFRQFVEDTKYTTYPEREGYAPVIVPEQKKPNNEEGLKDDLLFLGSDIETSPIMDDFDEGKEVKGANWQQPESKDSVFETGRVSHPVVTVSWLDAQAYCEWQGKRLPTEAEWEFAAKARRPVKKVDPSDFSQWWERGLSEPIGNFADEVYARVFVKPKQPGDVDDLMLTHMNGYNDGFVRTSPVGTFVPNPLNLYDMEGNVAEWVSNWIRIDEDDDEHLLYENPKGLQMSIQKFTRGSHWHEVPSAPVTFGGYRMSPVDAQPTIGFRCAKNIHTPKPKEGKVESPSTEPITKQPPADLPSSNKDTKAQADNSPRPALNTPDSKNTTTSVVIPAGSFQKTLRTPTREVLERTIYINAFRLDRFEVTNAQFSRFIEETGYQTTAERAGYARVTDNVGNSTNRPEAYWLRPDGINSVFEQDKATHPVVSVTWSDAQAYCGWEGKRLPTDAEWEYAGMAGRTPNSLSKHEQHDENSIENLLEGEPGFEDTDTSRQRVTAPVGSFPANPWDLHDMIGNVAEWVKDWDDRLFRLDGPVVNPQGPETGTRKVTRGGSGNTNNLELLWKYRSHHSPRYRSDWVGFRCAEDIPEGSGIQVEVIVPVEPQAEESFPEPAATQMVPIPAGEFLMGYSDESSHTDSNPSETQSFEDSEEPFRELDPAELDQLESHHFESPQHLVSVSAFRLDQHEVTNAQFFQFVQDTGYVTSAEKKRIGMAFKDIGGLQEVWKASWRKPDGKTSIFQPDKANHPVRTVSWKDAQAYCEWNGKRLPTEAEWEYAARAGTLTLHWWGGEFASPQPKANVADESLKEEFHKTHPPKENIKPGRSEVTDKNFLSDEEFPPEEEEFPLDNEFEAQDDEFMEESFNEDFGAPEFEEPGPVILKGYTDGFPSTAPVRSFKPNPWGIHDLDGNVREWVSDWFTEDYYARSTKQNPRGPESGRDKMVRGSSFHSWPDTLHVTSRWPGRPTTSHDDIGFRCASDVKASEDADESAEQQTESAPGVPTAIPDGTSGPEEQALDETPKPSVEQKPSLSNADRTETSINPGMVLIPEGSLEEIDIHEFFLDKFEVSNLDFQEFVEATSYRTTAEQTLSGAVFVGDRFENYLGVNWREPEGLWLFTPDEKTSVFDTGRTEHPVTLVSWEDAQAYCEWTGKRLPSEAEWEYAARSGTTSAFWWGDDLPGSRPLENFADETHQRTFPKRRLPIVEKYEDGFSRTAPIGSFVPNPWGLYDMIGNVAEWVSDWNDRGDHKNKVIRGGSWVSIPDALRSESREMLPPSAVKSSIGFRCAKDAQESH